MSTKLNTYEIGDGAAVHIGSDCYPVTVIGVTTKTVTIQYDSWKTNDDHDYYGKQSYSFFPNLEGKIKRFFQNKHGSFTHDKSYFLSQGRKKYIDPHF